MQFHSLVYLFLIAFILAIGIAYRQYRRGYTFHKALIGALIGLLGLAGLLVQFFSTS
jgi:hypothetical protein